MWKHPRGRIRTISAAPRTDLAFPWLTDGSRRGKGLGRAEATTGWEKEMEAGETASKRAGPGPGPGPVQYSTVCTDCVASCPRFGCEWCGLGY